ncbi:unnamed protein product [Symbiodinium natans]|uniref:Uncharacterized protein n=1 Tax=Symbiodinium natans TaxID=878477 RepID=A0A812LCM5_9DINO|nr:unnamed protein product [Symbiodinium natans]
MARTLAGVIAGMRRRRANGDVRPSPKSPCGLQEEGQRSGEPEAQGAEDVEDVESIQPSDAEQGDAAASTPTPTTAESASVEQVKEKAFSDQEYDPETSSDFELHVREACLIGSSGCGL